MGFGKFLAGVVGGAVAIVAAPVILPVAAAAAATAGAAAAASAGAAAIATAGAVAGTAAAATATAGAVVGTAAAATATAGAVLGTATSAAVATAGAAAATVGSVAGTVGGVAGTIGTTIASSTVGTAVGGSMATVGTAISGVAQSASVITGSQMLGAVGTIGTTSSGAAALGTIATTGTVGIVSGVDGAQKMKEAKEILDRATKSYNKNKKEYDSVLNDTESKLNSLGQLKLDVWTSFERFSLAFEKIKNKPVFEGFAVRDELFDMSIDENEIEGIAFTAQELIKSSASAAGAGVCIGIAAYGGTMTLGVASTGTAIGTLSGVAATNATLAALGGGSLASGGLGMAGGSVVLGGVVAGPMIAIGGVLLSLKGSDNLEKAKQAKSEVDDIVSKTVQINNRLRSIAYFSNLLENTTTKLYYQYLSSIQALENTVTQKTNYNEFTYEEKKTLEKNIVYVKVLKELTMLSIYKENDTNKINEELINSTIDRTEAAVTKVS